MHKPTSIIALLATFTLPHYGSVFCQENVTQEPNLLDPRALYLGNYTLPLQGFPGIQSNFEIPPDCGEGSYVGTGRLVGRRALITGGDSGIGRAVAIAFAREGANIVINYLDEEELDAQDVISVINSTTSSQIFAVPGDLRSEAFCNELVATAADLLGGLDILVNNAAYSNVSTDIATMSLASFNQTIETNIYAPFWLSRAARRIMPPGSSIIFTTSAIVRRPSPGLIDYAATKGFLTTFMEALATQLATSGIRVNAVAPALTLTNFLTTQGLTTELMNDAVTLNAPMGRILQPVEIAPVYVGLAENAASYISGGTWSVTGGRS